jgi:transcriptional regulator EpsA
LDRANGAIRSQGRTTVAELAGSFSEESSISLEAKRPLPGIIELAADDGRKFIRMVSRASGIRRHYELFQLLQNDVQFFVPHQVMISAWGDFVGSNFALDVISALPGVRTGQLDGCNIDETIVSLHGRWLANGRLPVLLDSAGIAGVMQRGCECALHRSLRAMKSAVVHGIHDARDGSHSLYFAANPTAIVRDGGSDRSRFLLDSVFAQIEIAFRRVGGLKTPGVLSSREEEILGWVSEGKTNVEISEILEISSFTVKNHLHRIMKKLGVSNRTEAVARYRQRATPRRAKGARENAAVLAE